jgi:phosphatidylinositol alpha-mannosyltransferase
VLQTYEQAIAIGEPARSRQRLAARVGFASADLLPKVPPQRLESLEPAPRRSRARKVIRLGGRLALLGVGVTVLAFVLLTLQRAGLARVLASIVSSQPGLVAAGLGTMCAAMVLRALAWHAILAVAPTWRQARRRDAMQGTFVGVLMSATLPVRLGETSRALIVARRLGRARETLPVVLGSIVAQTLLNILALVLLGVGGMLSVDPLLRGDGILLALALAPAGALLTMLIVPILLPAEHKGRLEQARGALGIARQRLREGIALFSHPKAAGLASVMQFAAWALQMLACWLVLMALGLDGNVSFGAAAAVLFAVNVTAFVPLTPANVGVFQAAVVVVLAGAYHRSSADALAYGIVLQAVELAAAVAMGLPALVAEGFSWRQLRLRTIHASPVRIRPLPQGSAQLEMPSPGTS